MLFSIKRGSTFTVVVSFTDNQREPVNIDPDDLKSRVQNSSKGFHADLTVIPLEDVGQFELRCADTSDWPVGNYKMDIMRRVLRENGFDNIPTDTLIFNVVEGVTPRWSQ